MKRGWLTVVLALVGLVMVTAPAFDADAAKKKAKKASDKSAKQEAEEAEKSAEERKAPAKFDWAKDSQSVDMDRRADKARDEAIAKLKKLLPTVQEGPQKADLTFRLSEMFWAKAKFKHLEAMQLWDKRLDEWTQKGQKGAQPQLDDVSELGESERYKKSALELYETILDKYPDYPRKDEVLYNLGSSMYEGGDKTKGVEMYWKLIKQYPDSDFAPDAWLQLGEHFFNANKLTQAVKAYAKAAETKKPRIYSFALYKLAWCDYNLQEYDNALDKFRQVVAYSKKQKEAKGDGTMAERDRIQLLEESLSDMVRAYSHLDAVDDAFEYYTGEVGKERARKYLQKLAGMYHTEGKFATEIKTYEKLNTVWPYAPDAPENQTAIMNAYAQLGKNDMVRKEVRRLIDLYSPNGVWAQKNSSNQKGLEQAFEIVERELAGLVTEQHRAAQQTKMVDTYKLARDIYKEYLEKFTDSANTYKFRFFYAEILYELKDFDLAAAQYDLVAEANAQGEFAKPSGYTAILAWEKVVAGVKEEVSGKIQEGKRGKQKGELTKLEKLERLEKGKKYNETPLSEAELKLAAACDRFVKIAPGDDEVVKVKFKSARLYYIHNQFEPAAERFGEIIDKWPKDSLARISAESIVESFNVREDWSNLNKWSRKFAGNTELASDKDFNKRIGEYVEGASFNEIHFVYEPKEGPKEIGARYVAFAKEFPKSKYAMVGLYNAVVNFDKANVLEDALAQADAILKNYKDFKLSDEDLQKSKAEGTALPQPEDIREKTMFLAASFQERLAEFEPAADLYEQYAKEFKTGPRRSDAIFNAGLFREGLGQFDKAIENFSSYVKEFPKAKDKDQINWRIGLILEKKKDYKASQAHFAGWTKMASTRDEARALCAEFKVSEALKKQGKDKDARAMQTSIVSGFKSLSGSQKIEPCPLEASASAAFALLEPEYEAYEAISLTGVSEKVMTDNLLKKLQLVQELEKKYTMVLSIGHGDYGIASLYRIGKVYQHLAQAMLETPCPKRLDDDQCGIYLAALQEKAFPLEEKAIEAFDKAMNKGYELGLYNDWLAKAQEAMKTYEPQRFPDLHTYDLIASEAAFEVPRLVAAEVK